MIKLFADGANFDDMVRLASDPRISGLTTNPTLMLKAGVTDYKSFAQKVLAAIPDKPISFEVFADDHEEIVRQAQEISSWGNNVYVKIPVYYTNGTWTFTAISQLVDLGIKVNVTAVFTVDQVDWIRRAINSTKVPAYISIFAGRIADTGVDPVGIVKESLILCDRYPNIELIWASPRELLNVYQAEESGCHIITATPDILAKLSLVGKDLNNYSIETCQMFFNDGQKAGYKL